jgi:hypothetical protein
MRISEIAEHLKARIWTKCDLDKQVASACGADLMSDVLAFVKHNTVLLTGLVNQHVIRTAEMIDISCIVFVRGKVPPPEVCELAYEKEIVLMTTDASMFEACGRLYQKGLPASMEKAEAL